MKEVIRQILNNRFQEKSFYVNDKSFVENEFQKFIKLGADHDLNVNWALWAHCVAITPICKSSGERIWTSEAHRHRIMKPARYQASDTPQIVLLKN